MRCRNFGAFGNDLTSLFANEVMDADQVANGEGEACFPVVEDETAGVELVVHVRRWRGAEAADDVHSEWRRDVAGGGAGFEGLGQG